MKPGPPREAFEQLRKIFDSTSGFEALVSGNRVTLLHDGEQAFPAMLEAIAEAKREILLEMYWFASDAVGRQFAEALIVKADAGVRVRVIYDAVGSIQSDRRMFASLRDAGCEVEEYNPIAPWRSRFRIGVVNNRDHRKLLVVDRQVGFTGGVNLGDEWAPVSAGGGGWRDDIIRIEGPAVEQMCDIFDYGWLRIVEPQALVRHRFGPPIDTGDGQGSRVRVLANHYFRERRAIRQAYLRRIESARRSVCIANSYFVPDGRIRRVLAQAVERGAEVRVIVPGKSDVPAVRHAARKLYGPLLQAGIQLYEWQGSILHSKTAVIDGRWCTVGTYNLDSRSLRFNLEVTAAVEDAAVAGAMEDRFNEDLEHAKPVSYDEWRRRPLHERMLDNFFYRFRRLL
ncbi:MAG: cardiolipin synthase ClsB [Deltaproteobacteria bacterium]|nr:cardiolipin synthase ClsB [Deltaproteobacteria bacterium]